MNAVLIALLATSLLASCSPKSQPSSAEPAKILIVGIDGAAWHLLDPLIERGRAPAFQLLIEDGVRSPLATLEPTLSPAIWTTIATGKLPEKHGIFGFGGVPGLTMKTLPTSQMRKTKAFWNMVSQAGKTVGMVNWWVTWPSETVNGFIVSDRVAYTRMEASVNKERATEFDTYPEELMGEIDPFIEKPNDIANDEVKRFMNLSDEEIDKLLRAAEYDMGTLLPEFKYAYQADKSTAKVGEYLLNREMPELFAIFFAGVDVVSHLFWQFMEPDRFRKVTISEADIARYGRVIEETYLFTDELVGRLLNIVDEDYTVIVLSDHGFGPTGRLPWSGGHGKTTPGGPIAPDGILVLSGRNIRKGVRLENAHILDILPTVLYLMGLPVARDMEGKVLIEAIGKEFLKKHPITYIDTYDEEGWGEANEPLISDPQRDRDMLEKLRVLGYVE